MHWSSTVSMTQQPHHAAIATPNDLLSTSAPIANSGVASAPALTPDAPDAGVGARVELSSLDVVARSATESTAAEALLQSAKRHSRHSARTILPGGFHCTSSATVTQLILLEW